MQGKVVINNFPPALHLDEWELPKPLLKFEGVRMSKKKAQENTWFSIKGLHSW